MEILKLNPVFKDYIWGGTRLRDDFGLKTDINPVAEGWMLACHKDGMNTIDGGEYDGKTLESVIKEGDKSKIAGTNSEKFPYFPVLIKLIDAKIIYLFRCTPTMNMRQELSTNSARRKCGMCLTRRPAQR